MDLLLTSSNDLISWTILPFSEHLRNAPAATLNPGTVRSPQWCHLHIFPFINHVLKNTFQINWVGFGSQFSKLNAGSFPSHLENSQYPTGIQDLLLHFPNTAHYQQGFIIIYSMLFKSELDRQISKLSPALLFKSCYKVGWWVCGVGDTYRTLQKSHSKPRVQTRCLSCHWPLYLLIFHDHHAYCEFWSHICSEFCLKCTQWCPLFHIYGWLSRRK